MKLKFREKNLSKKIQFSLGLVYKIFNMLLTRREFYGKFYHTECGNLVFYKHSGDFSHTCLCFYYVYGNIRHTEYCNNYHTVEFHTVL